MKTTALVLSRPHTAVEPTGARAATPVKGSGTAAPSVSSLHRFTPYGSDAISTESIAHGGALIGLLAFVCLLFASCFDVGLIA